MSRLFRLVLKTLNDILSMFVIYLPGQSGVIVRQLYYRARLKSMGKSVRIGPGVFFQHPESISIGHNCSIDKGVVLLAGKPVAGEHRRIIKGSNRDAEGEIVLGNDIHIAPYSTISGMGGLRIGNNSKIASHAAIYTYTYVSLKPTILYADGMEIGESVIIGAHSTIIGISKIDSEEIIRPHTFLSGTLFGK